MHATANLAPIDPISSAQYRFAGLDLELGRRGSHRPAYPRRHDRGALLRRLLLIVGLHVAAGVGLSLGLPRMAPAMTVPASTSLVDRGAGVAPAIMLQQTPVPVTTVQPTPPPSSAPTPNAVIVPAQKQKR